MTTLRTPRLLPSCTNPVIALVAVVAAAVVAVTTALAVTPARAADPSPGRAPVGCSVRHGDGPPGTDLQAAIDAAPGGAVLKVRGVCRGSFTLTRDVVLAGPAVLDGTTCTAGSCDSSTVLSVESGSDVRLRRITVQGGSSTYDGGGIQNSGRLRLASSVVRDNIAEDNGGGIVNDGHLILTGRTRVVDNELYYTGAGGGILNRGRLVLNQWARVARNRAALGAGVHNVGVVVLNAASSVTRNTASESGGGILNDGGRVWFSPRWRGTLCGNTPDDWPTC